MRRVIIDFDFDVDDEADWIARLSCGHSQHVRHRPPFQERTWVLGEETRRAKLGTYLLCPLCDRAELPEGLKLLRTSPLWDNESAPSAFKNFHHLAEGAWGVIKVEDGRIRFVTHGEVVMNILIGTNSRQAIPPGLDHSVEFAGAVRFSIDYFCVERGGPQQPIDEAGMSRDARRDSIGDQSIGGEPACFANLVCTVCGGVLESDPHTHRI